MIHDAKSCRPGYTPTMDPANPEARPPVRPAAAAPLSSASLDDLVRASLRTPVFVTGGPPRAPFPGPGARTWMNPEYALHHAVSWDSPFVLGAMLPLRAAAEPASRAGESLLARSRASLQELRDAPLPLIAQVWGPMTMAAQRAGLERYVESLAGSDDAYSLTAHGLEVALTHTRAALEARPLVVWIAEPLAAVTGPDALAHVWIPAMRRLVAEVRSAGADPVAHISGEAVHTLPAIARLGLSGVSITADTPLAATREMLPEHVVVFGNLDSMRLLDRDSAWLRAEATAMVQEMRGRRFVVTPGSAVPERISVEQLEAFIDGARDA